MLKSLFLFFSILLATYTFAEEKSWVTHHQEAVKCLPTDAYQAVMRYTDAINSLTNKEDPKTLFLYFERGSILLDKKRLELAFKDFNHVLFTLVPHNIVMIEGAKKLPPDQLDLFCLALHQRLRYFALTNKIQDLLEESAILDEIDPRKLTIENLGNGFSITRNFPADQVKDTIDMFLKLDLIEKAEDIQYSSSGVLTIKNKEQCSVSEEDDDEEELAEFEELLKEVELFEKGKKKHNKSEEDDKIPPNVSSTMLQHLKEMKVTHCKSQCDSIFEACRVLIRHLPNVKMSATAAYGLNEIKELAYLCCEGEKGFYRTCIKPLIRKLGELKGMLGIPDDPAFENPSEDSLTNKRDEYERQQREYWNSRYKY